MRSVETCHEYLAQRKGKYMFFSPTSQWILSAPSTIKPEEREFVADSGACIHVFSRKDLNSAELDTVKASKNPTTVVTANGEVLTKEEGNSVCQRIEFIRDSNASRRYTGSSFTRKTLRRSRNHSGSSSSSSPTSPASSSQEAATPTEHPASTRNESVSEEVRGNSSHDLPEWLEEFKENLVDESVPQHRDASSSSHDLPSEPRAKVVSGKHSILLTSRRTELRYLLEIQNYKGVLQKTHWYCRAQSGKFLVIFKQRITKFSVKDVNLDTIIDSL